MDRGEVEGVSRRWVESNGRRTFCSTTRLDVQNFPPKGKRSRWAVDGHGPNLSMTPISKPPHGTGVSQSQPQISSADGESEREGWGEEHIEGWRDGATKCPRSQITGRATWSSALYLTFNQCDYRLRRCTQTHRLHT